MAKAYVTPEEGAKQSVLLEEHAKATIRGAYAIAKYGMSCEAFQKAEAETDKIAHQIKAIQGTAGKHWMAQ